MEKPMCRCVSLGLVAGMILIAGPAGAAAAGAAAAGAMPRVRTAVPLVLSRTHAAPMRFRPVQATNGLRSPSPPVLMLPPLAPARFNVLPLLQPLEAEALTSAGFEDCSRARSGVLIAMLPVAPFAPRACSERTGTLDAGDRETSLVPGRNKNALYGRAYSPHDLDAP